MCYNEREIRERGIKKKDMRERERERENASVFLWTTPSQNEIGVHREKV